jgi:hypothetical protein
MFLFKAGGRYHLACAENIDGRYSCMVATSTNLMGPYGERCEAIPGGGHNTFFQDTHGQWFSTYFGPPWYERAAILPITIEADGCVQTRDD